MEPDESFLEPNHDIPKSFLERLDSFVYGGFILASVNKEGQTVIINTIEHPTLDKGVRGMIGDYLDCIEEEERAFNFNVNLDEDLDDDENSE